MTPSPACLALIKQCEGLRLKAYRDSGSVLTIGYGHTRGVKAAQVITEAQADELLAADAQEAAEAVNRHALPCTQGQFDALTDFVFNLGEDRFANSTLLRMHQLGNFTGAAQQFGRWIYDNGRVLPGLVRRRALEAAMYLGEG
jgi:lysozyme